MRKLIIAIISTLALISCTISYKFNGTVINYDIIKTIAIKDFTNQAAMVYAPLASTFNEGLKDVYTKQTRLDLVEANGDLELEGEIVCVGIVANMNFILICTYELDGANPELIIYKKR